MYLLLHIKLYQCYQLLQQFSPLSNTKDIGRRKVGYISLIKKHFFVTYTDTTSKNCTVLGFPLCTTQCMIKPYVKFKLFVIDLQVVFILIFRILPSTCFLEISQKVLTKKEISTYLHLFPNAAFSLISLIVVSTYERNQNAFCMSHSGQNYDHRELCNRLFSYQ